MYRLAGQRCLSRHGAPLRKYDLFARSVSYTLPIIPNLESAKVGEQSFHGLYSNNSVNELWFKRGQHLIDGLNRSLQEHQIENPPSDLNELITLTFNKPDLSGIYSHASLLHNLQFTFESLKPNENKQIVKSTESALLQTPNVFEEVSNAPTDANLNQWIIDSFGSLVEFRTLLLNSAKGIKGDGITWLVARASRSENGFLNHNSSDLTYKTLSVMNTYNAGIVDDAIRSGQIEKFKQQKAAKIEALRRKQQEKELISNSESSTPSDEVEPEIVNETSTEFAGIPKNLILGTIEEAEFATLYSDCKLLPLLAIDASMRNYLLDYGIYGKQEYLNNFWDCIDWDVVAKRLPPRFKATVEL